MDRFPKLNYIFNPEFSSTNTIHSLGLALTGKDCFVLNGDVVFDKEILKMMKHRNCAAVKYKRVSKEEVQVIIDKKGDIRKIGKSIGGAGEAVGIYRFSSDFSSALKTQITKMPKQLFYEDAIDKVLPRDFMAIDIGNFRAIEIDTNSDYLNASREFTEE